MRAFDYHMKNARGLVGLLVYAVHYAVWSIARRPLIALASLGLFFLVGWYDVIAGFFVALFFCFWRYRWEPRVPGALAIVCLIACPLLLAASLTDAATMSAVFAWYFLVITVALQLVGVERSVQVESLDK